MPLVKTTCSIFFCHYKKYSLLFVLVFLFANHTYTQQNLRDSLKTSLKILKSQKSFSTKDTVYINMLNELGVNLRFYKRDSLLVISEQALTHSKSAKYKKGEIEALFNIGDYYSDKGIGKKGLYNYQTALSIANESGVVELILHAQNKIADQYSYQGNYAKALEGYLKGIELAEEVDNIEMLAILTENIALLYGDQKDYAQALVYLKKVKKMNGKIGNEVCTAYTLSNIASIHADMGNLEHAMYNVNQSIAIFEKHKLMDWLAFAFEVKGKTYLKQNKFKWALYWYDQGRMLHDKNIEDERGEIDLLNGIAEAHIGLKKDSISETYALRAMNISTRLNENEGIKKSAEVLYKINKKRKDYITALVYHELFQKLSDTIARNGSEKSLVMLKIDLNHEQQKEDLILQNEKALAKQKNYVYATLAILLVLLTITLLVRRSEKTQKSLNKKLNSKKIDLEKSEGELRETNETKDKLFSIIGHDLRGPIGAFQGLLQLLKNDEINQKEFMEFVPKLRKDIDHISFTLNNLLSWGQTQMNGSVTKPSIVSLESLVTDNINLLSEIADAKSIKMISQLSKNTLAWSDTDQIDIVIRNLMSNALKFTPKNGMVTIVAQEKNAFWEICIRDTGVGIDQETQNKLFAKNANITTYGTDNEKGTGLGLSLCKEMVEKNNGTIWVESVLRKGTCFYFTVLKAKTEYEKTG
ncbi:FIG00651925: hypothetical protein [hydrothermal vent metagenome]|uniref:histidine kinase n=1 Tax=hydrothermal vent metagenome TaxID=652676 RepID=A0A3B0TM25_9ZZZZ